MPHPERLQPSSRRNEFMPKLITIFRDGYTLRDFQADALAGLTVAIVAVPLALAIAIASGAPPERGLYTAIAAGFIASLFGGSRFQISGPTSAFIVVVYATIERHGYEGLALATVMAGLMLVTIGLLRLGAYIKYIPYPVVAGFSAGIAVTILLTQIKELLGLDIAEMPAHFPANVQAIGGAIGTFDPATIAITMLSLAIIIGLKKIRPNWPGFLFAVVIASCITASLGLDISTIQSRFGGVPNTLPMPALPSFSVELAMRVLPDAITIALLAGIEALLSAVVADGMSGRRHRSNCELLAQGLGNIGSVIFGGIPATGALARTATNVRAGARGPMSGMLHAVYLVFFMAVAAPLIGYVPLAALGAVLAIVAWNMSDYRHFGHIMKGAIGDRVILLVTFGLTILVDLTVAIQAGVVVSALVFMHRMAEIVHVESTPTVLPESSDEGEVSASDPDIVVYRIDGPFFFGTSTKVAQVLERIGTQPRTFILDFSAVPFVDSTAAHALESFVAKAHRAGIMVYFANVRRQPRHELKHEGLKPPKVRYAASVADAVEAARRGSVQPFDDSVAI